MSKLREAAKAALTAYEKFRDVDDIDGLDGAVDRLRAALAEPKTELRDQHKAFTHWYFGLRGINKANFSPEDLAWAAWKAALAKPEAEPPRDEWREAVLGALEICMILNEANRDDPERAMSDLMGWEPRDEWRPASEPPDTTRSVLIWLRFGDVETFGKTLGGPSGFAFQNGAITHWRDVTPPMESPIAAKCQRVEGSGEICGLTPPCPDCGSSLIDVADGSL